MAAPAASGLEPSVVTLTADDVARLRPSWRSRLGFDDIYRALADVPDCSVWVPETLEYAIASEWRNRSEILQIAEISGVQHAEQLVRGVADRARQHGIGMAVMVELDETRSPAFYHRCGFAHLERVLTYEIDRRDIPAISRPRELTIVPADPSDPATMAELLRIDHAAFPWLWVNSRREFSVYGAAPGVELYLGLDAGRPVSYIGVTTFPGWGHLDRIAVDPTCQGKGLGLYSLAVAVDVLLQRGARRVGLSTQSTNERSRRLYERYGFVHTPANDYDLYGSDFREPVLTTQGQERVIWSRPRQ